MFKLYLNSDNLIEFNGATDVAAIPQVPITGATVTASLYDDAADAWIMAEEFVLSEDEAAAQVTLSVFGVPKVTVAIGDVVRIAQDDGTHHQTTIAAGSTTTTLVLAAGLASAASKGKPVKLLSKALGVDTLRLDRVIPFELGEQVSVDQDDGTKHITTVSDRDLSTNEIVLADVTTALVSVGNLVAQKIGADVTMTQYGTPAANDNTWGYRGTIADTHAGLKLGQRVRAVINFNGGAGLQREEYLYGRVQNGGA